MCLIVNHLVPFQGISNLGACLSSNLIYIYIYIYIYILLTMRYQWLLHLFLTDFSWKKYHKSVTLTHIKGSWWSSLQTTWTCKNTTKVFESNKQRVNQFINKVINVVSHVTCYINLLLTPDIVQKALKQ